MNRSNRLCAALLSLLSLIAFSCGKPENEANKEIEETAEGMTYKNSFDVSIPEQVIDKRKVDGYLFEVHSPEVRASEVVELHLQIFPLYGFGDSYAAGDYYCIEGFILSHNSKIYAERADRDVKIYGWYPEEYTLEFELLSPDGKSIGSDEVEFLVSPEPSTTIGTTTYRKGSSFSLGLSVTFGVVKPEDPTGILSWANTLLGGLSFGYTYENSSTQELPDQSVDMSTGSSCRVKYSFNTNNDEGDYSTSSIPPIFRTDQIASFSWVWHLKKGNYCAKDYDFGNMKMRYTIHPKYKTAYNGKIVDTHGRAIFKGRYSYRHQDMTADIDLPAINRIPTGDVKLKFATTSNNYFLTELKVYRAGESLTADKPYYSDTKIYSRNQIITIPLRVGKYDISYKIVKGSGGATVSSQVLSDIEVLEGETTETFTPF